MTYFVTWSPTQPPLVSPIIVIPGRTGGASPEPMNTDLAADAQWAGPWRIAVFLGSGLSASPSPGMTVGE